MIISKTPLRISFFGGGTDYPNWIQENGGKVISTTINKYVYLSCRILPPFFDHKYRISYSKIDLAKKLHNISHKPVREIINYLKIKEGLEIHYDADLPAKSGMGSSSAFIVGLLNSLYALKKINISKILLAKKSINIEQKILNEIVGLQDQVATSYGGFNFIEFKKNCQFTVKRINIKNKVLEKLNNNLFLVFTGLDRQANVIAKSYVDTLNNKNYYNLKFIMDTVDLAIDYLKKNNLDAFGDLLHESWLYKKKLSKIVTNTTIDDIYSKARKNGALGGKILGAGGGGFMILYVPASKHEKFKKAFSNQILIPFKFEKNGSQIILNT
jgi:D-glycero-alpha-D-manno-heptose-7-phosphate kinase